MLTDLLREIKAGGNVKENVLSFKQELKNFSGDIPSEIKNDYRVFVNLLHDEDPKIRKNSVLILKELKVRDAAESIYEAYLNDTTLFNKASYIKALSAIDHTALDSRLTEHRNDLALQDYPEEQRKHAVEEIHELSHLLRSSYPEPVFTGNNLVNEFVLLTNRNFKKITMDALKGIPHKEFTAGVMVKTAQLDAVMNNIRTYSELLFIPDCIRMCSSSPEQAADELITAGITDYLYSRIDISDSPLFFRIDYRTKDSKKAADFAHRLADALEYGTHFKLINSTDSYNIELRFIDTSNDKLIVLVRFCTLADQRFLYRKQAIAVSLKPSTAALLAELADPYLKQNSAVIDPFCGCGTMLVERDRYMPTRIMYGIDIFGEAIEAARVNIKAAGLSSKTELVTRDFFEFRHDYRFDEVFTDMPAPGSNKSLADIDTIYSKFFRRIPGLLESDAKLFIYTRNRDLLRKYSLTGGFRILAEYEISKTEGSYYFILSKG